MRYISIFYLQKTMEYLAIEKEYLFLI
jgi:hypothetical protein